MKRKGNYSGQGYNPKPRKSKRLSKVKCNHSRQISVSVLPGAREIAGTSLVPSVSNYKISSQVCGSDYLEKLPKRQHEFDRNWDDAVKNSAKFRDKPGKRTNGQMFKGEFAPFSLLTEDGWGLLMKLVSPTDRLSICRTNSQLDDSFGENKYEWLFGAVLPFILRRFTHKSQLLKCRHVCKTWRHQVDSFLEYEHPSRRPYERTNSMEQFYNRLHSSYNCLRQCNLDYVKFTPKTLRNCFPENSQALIGKAVYFQISYCSDLEINQFWSVASKFLRKHGENVWHFKFVKYNMQLTRLRFYQMVNDCIHLLPNLRSLEVRSFLDLQPRAVDEDNLLKFIKENPLPQLGYLNSVDIEGFPEQAQNLFIGHRKADLMRLSLWNLTLDDLGFPPRLAELQLTCNDIRFLDGLMNYLKTHSAPLQKLTLNIRCPVYLMPGGQIPSLANCPQLTQFRIILQYASTTVYNECCLQGWDFQYSQVPSVQFFEVEAHGKNLFDFCPLLFAFPNLRYLHFRDSTQPGYNDNPKSRYNWPLPAEKVQIAQYLCENKVEESPIWNTLNDLQVLTFESLYGNFRRFCNRAQVNWYRNSSQNKT